MNKQQEKTHDKILKLLEKNMQVAVIWSVEDVRQFNPKLTDEQAYGILKHTFNRWGAEMGWKNIKDYAINYKDNSND